MRFHSQKLYPLVDFLAGMQVVEADAVAPSHLRLWFVHLQETGHNESGVHGFYRAANAFFSRLHAEEMVAHNPMSRIKAPKVPEEPLQPITVEEVRDLLATCDPKSEVGARDRAVILCLWDSGCRASEFIALNYEDLDLKTGALLVRQGKGRKARVTFLGARSRREVLRYLRFRGDLGSSAPFFATDTGTRMGYSTLRDIIRYRARHAGIEAPSLHAFRRGFAPDGLRNGADVYSLQKMMGHTSLVVLRRYLRQTQDELQKVHEETGPVDRLLQALYGGPDGYDGIQASQCVLRHRTRPRESRQRGRRPADSSRHHAEAIWESGEQVPSTDLLISTARVVQKPWAAHPAGRSQQRALRSLSSSAFARPSVRLFGLSCVEVVALRPTACVT